jgi:hypothetical protein
MASSGRTAGSTSSSRGARLRRAPRRQALRSAGALLAAVVVAWAAAGAEAARPLRTGLLDPSALTGSDYTLGLTRIRGSGSTLVRTFIPWATIAPRAPAAGSDAADPANPAYRWDVFDARLRAMEAAGLEALAGVSGSPPWARQQATGRGALPEPARLAAFAQAAARRYSGTTASVPAVRYWALWNEPNVSFYFRPQLDDAGKPISPVLYRQLLQAFTPGIRRGNPKARVVAGATSPFGRRSARVTVIAPMRFLRDVLCVSAGSPRRTCRVRVPFDVWSHHPYTSRGPTGTAIRADDVSLGDLGGMRRLLTAAQRLGQIDSRGGAAQLWVTEFSWDTNPPDPAGVPALLHARWTAEALYRMWRSGASAVVWFALRDEPAPPGSVFQSGLWYRGASFAQDRPKPTLQAFRFPLVAFPERGRVFVWGRTPAGRPGIVIVERSFRGGWARLGRLTTNEHGIFTTRFRVAARTGFVRARFVGSKESARPFSLVHPGEYTYNPFGS